MRKLLVGLAVWNTAVAAVNVFVLPLFVPAEAMVYVTPTSQVLPVVIPLVLSALIGGRGDRVFATAMTFISK